MAGLISTTIRKDDPLASVVGYTPERGAVAPEETVAEQLRKVLATDSPLITGARSRAAQESNRRGLINTSMGVQAGEEAALSAALPVASADAATYATRALTNQAAGNQALQFTAGMQSQAAGQERAGQQAIEQQTLRGEQETGLQRLRGEQETGLQTLRGTQATQLQELKGSQDLAVQGLRGTQAERIANVEGGYREIVQTLPSAASLYNGVVKGIGDIMQNVDLDAESKQIAIDRYTDMLEGGLAVLGGIAGLNLNELLNFGGA